MTLIPLSGKKGRSDGKLRWIHQDIYFNYIT